MFIGGILLKLTSLVSLDKTIILSNYGGLCIDTYNIIYYPIKERYCIILSRKYWRSLNLAVLPQTMLFVAHDLNLAVLYSIAIRTCTQIENLADFNLVVERHTAKPPNLIPHQFFRLYIN